MKSLTRSETAQFLRSHDNYCILTHCKPDGDTVGSAAALCRGLRMMGKTAHVLENAEVTEKYRPFLEGLTCESCPENAVVVAVDIAAENRLAKGHENLLGNIALKIDHHGMGTGYADCGMVDGDAASCGEIIYDILVEMGVEMDRETAEAMYVAVSTDTGCFRFSNTDAHTLRTAAACLEAGAEIYPLNKMLFETTRLCRLKLNAYMAQNMEFLAGGTIALNRIPLEVEQETGVTQNDLDDVSGFARNIEGVCLSVTFRTEPGGGTKLSVRSVPGYDSAKVCAVFGGGGHAAAAGARLSCNQDEAREKVLAVLRDQGYIK